MWVLVQPNYGMVGNALQVTGTLVASNYGTPISFGAHPARACLGMRGPGVGGRGSGGQKEP